MTNKIFISFVLFLVLVKIIAVFSTDFNLFADEAQYWLWSKDLDFGYFSKPPLLAWCLWVYTSFFGDAFETLKFFSMPFYLFTAFFVYSLCKKLGFEKSDSLCCAIIFFIIPAASLSSVIVSTDVILLFFWIILINLVLEIRNNPKSLNFFFLGVFFGLAFLAKYAAVYFLICLIFLFVFDKKTRKSTGSNIQGVALFVLVSFVFILPNILWNYLNGWVTLSHTADNANLKNYDLNIFRGVGFLFTQLLMLGPFLFVGFLINIKNFKIDFENIYLLSFSLPIIIVVFVESVLVRANANWAAPALLALLILFYRSIKKHKTIIININFFFNLGLGLFLFFAIATSMPLKVFDRISGLKDFALEVVSITDGKTLVVNDRMLFSSLSYELKDRSIKILMPYNPSGPIKNHFQLKSKLEVGQNKKFYLVGSPENISYLSQKHQTKIIKTINKKFISEQIIIYEVSF